MRAAPPAASTPAPAAAPHEAPAERRGGSGRALGKGVATGGPAVPQCNRPGLGTEYGEAVDSPIYEVEFMRANASRPRWCSASATTTGTACSRSGSPSTEHPMACCIRRRRPAPDGRAVSRAPTRASPRRRPDGVALAIGGRAGRGSSVGANERRRGAHAGLPRRGHAGLRTPRRPSREAGLELPPPVRARPDDGGGSAAGGVLARGQERGRVAGRGQVLDLALHDRPQPLRRPCAASGSPKRRLAGRAGERGAARRRDAARPDRLDGPAADAVVADREASGPHRQRHRRAAAPSSARYF